MNKLFGSLLSLAILLRGATTFAESSPTNPPTAPPAVEPAPASTGQWVYTAQQGWIWIPYAQSYTYVTADGSVAYEYVYYPTFGWRWVPSPWVLGIGPAPFWGGRGYVRFAWYAHPWFGVHRYYGSPAHVRAAHVGGYGFHGGGRGRR
jgi:hypothetical protein